MAFQNVHSPVQAPKQHVDKYSFINDTTRRTYAGMVDIMDEAVGNITGAFKEAGYVYISLFSKLKAFPAIIPLTSKALKGGNIWMMASIFQRGITFKPRVYGMLHVKVLERVR